MGVVDLSQQTCLTPITGVQKMLGEMTQNYLNSSDTIKHNPKTAVNTIALKTSTETR